MGVPKFGTSFLMHGIKREGVYPMSFKKPIEIFFALFAAFCIGMSVIGIYRVLFALGGFFDLSLQEIFALIMEKIMTELSQ